MKKYVEDYSLTEKDIQLMEQKIAAFDLSREHEILVDIHQKIESMLASSNLNELTTELINDISRLYKIISAMPSLNNNLKRKILYALDYFINTDDEIPDEIPSLGYLDDLAVVRYVINQIISNGTEIYQS
ncbi:MAG: YkvA family protein [Fidelibacterota bacterium]